MDTRARCDTKELPLCASTRRDAADRFEGRRVDAGLAVVLSRRRALGHVPTVLMLYDRRQRAMDDDRYLLYTLPSSRYFIIPHGRSSWYEFAYYEASGGERAFSAVQTFTQGASKVNTSKLCLYGTC